MDDRLYGYLKIYVNYIRPAFVHSAAEDALFIKDDGKSFEKGTIGKRVAAFFKKAGVRDDIRVTSTRVRKIFSGAAFQLDPEKKRAVNYHMKHQQKTADRNYVIKLNAARSAEAHRIMKGIISGKENAKGQEDDETHEALETQDANQEEESIRKDHQKTTDRKASCSAEAHRIMKGIISGEENAKGKEDDETHEALETQDANQEEESIRKDHQKTTDRKASRSAEAHRIMKGIISGEENAKGQEDDETHEALETQDANQEEESIRKDHQKTTDRKASRSAESHSIMRDNTSSRVGK